MESSTVKAYEAFRVQCIIESVLGQQRVESLCWWNGLLLLGLQDGTILQYSAPLDGASWQVVKRYRDLARKAVTQMAAVRLKAKPLLLTLTDEGVNLLTLPEMQLNFQTMGSRGATLFAWSEDAQLLAVGVRRRVIMYQLKGSELLEAGERTAPDAVAAMMWVAPGILLLGMRRQYVLMDTTNGTVLEVAPTGTAPHPLAQLCAGGQEMLLVRDSSTYYHSTANGRYTRRRPLAWSEPLQALAAVGQHAVAVTASGLEVRSLRRVAEGHVVQRVALAEPPRPVPPAVSNDGTVFVAAAPPAATAAAASSSGGAPAAAVGSSSVYRLVSVPLEEQARTLAELGEYGEALALAALVDDEEEGGGGGETAEDYKPAAGGSEIGEGEEAGAAKAAARAGPVSSRREVLEERLRVAYGHYLFKAGEFDEGMAQLALCKSTTALVLLRLFPSLVPPKFKHYLPTTAAGQPLPDVAEPTDDAYVTAVSQLLPYVLSHRTRAMAALAEMEVAEAETEAAQGRESATTGPDAPSSGEAGISSSSPCQDGATRAAINGTNAKDVAAASAPRPPQPQSDTQQALPLEGANGAPDKTRSSQDAAQVAADAAATGVETQLRAFPPLPPPRELLGILDTAIVRIMAAMPDTGALLRFVQLPNYVDLQEGEAALSECAMYAELAALYKYNGCHEQGLELLRKLSQEPETLPQPPRGAAADLPGLPGVWAAVRYIVSLTAEQASIIQHHAGWILAADAEAGLSALLHMRPPLHPSLALSILNQHSRHYCGLYLETALQIGVALPQDYHNELLLIYLRDILAKDPQSPSRTRHAKGNELKELLLAHRPDPDQPPLLFPEDLAHALLNNPPAQHHPGHGQAASARRFASAPASSAGTPSTISRVPSQTSVRSSRTGGQPRGANGPSGVAGRVLGVSRRSGFVSDDTDSESCSSSDDEEEARQGEGKMEGRQAGGPGGGPPRPGTPTQSASGAPSREWNGTQSSAASAAGMPLSALRPARRPRRSSVGATAASKPPLLPATPREAAADRGGPASPPGEKSPDTNAEAAASAAAAAAAGPSLYQRLRDLVYTSPYIDPGYVLDKLPMGELLEIRALMLERLGSHREALALYVHALRDLAAAEAYCDRVYAAAVAADSSGGAGVGAAGALTASLLSGDPSRPGDIYLDLMQALFDGPESCPSAAAVAAAGGHVAQGASPGAAGWAAGGGREAEGGARLDPATWQALSRILSRKRDRLDPMKVLSMLPDAVAVADVLPWLESALRYTVEAQRNLAVIRQLRRSENLSALEEAIRVRQHRVVVTSERACSLCHKRIGGAVTVSYPGGLLAHYSCHKRHTGGAGGGGAGGAELIGGGGFGCGVPGVIQHPVVELHHSTARVTGGRGTSAGGAAELAAWA